jgi:hypothetical protein
MPYCSTKPFNKFERLPKAVDTFMQIKIEAIIV